jgi:hypothetical protein
LWILGVVAMIGISHVVATMLRMACWRTASIGKGIVDDGLVVTTVRGRHVAGVV